MNSIVTLVSEIESIARDSLSVSELTMKLNHKLQRLRALYSADQSLFTDDNLRYLKNAARIPKLIGEFSETLEEAEYITHREDAEELLGRFAEIQQQLDGCAISGRVAKEARQVLESYNTLPQRWRSTEEQPKSKLEHHLRAVAPKCPRCSKTLVLRESMYGLFWGCRDFPACYGKQRLNSEQAKLLRDDASLKR